MYVDDDIPVPHYETFSITFFRSENVSESLPPPPPSPPQATFFRAVWRRSIDTFRHT